MTLKTIAAGAFCIKAGGQFFLQSIAALALSLGISLAHAQPSTRQVSLPNQDYTESTEDLAVKVLGGQVAINRTWTFGRWYLNDRWADLVLQPDPLGGVLAVNRADRIYTRVSGTAQPTYRFDENNYIKAIGPDAATFTGWQWYDREGNTIDYDATGHMLGWVNAAGVKVTLARDSQGRLSAVKDHHGREVLSLQYNASGQPTTISDNTGRSVRYEWSVPGASAGTGPNGSIGTALLTQVTDIRGGTWRYTYTPAGYIQTRTDPAGGQIRLSYMTQPARVVMATGMASTGSGSTKVSLPPAPRVASLTDETGGVTNYRIDYDRVRREYLVNIQQPGGSVHQRRYDSGGKLLQNSVDGMDLSVVSKVSATQERITDARGLVTTIQYDSASARRPIKTIHPDGSSETSSYDPVYNRKTRHTNALGIVSTWAYDAQGNPTQYTEAQGRPEQRTTHSTYDPYGQLTSRTRGAGDGRGPDAITERYEYDDAGNVTKITDGEGHATRYSYNSLGKVLSQTNALGHTTTYAYDAAGNRTSSTNALNETTSYGYDARGRRTQAVSAEGRIQAWVYDSVGRIVETRQPGQSAGQGTRIGYDQAGNQSQITSPSGLVTKASYDSQRRITRTEDPAGNVTTYEYGAKGSPLAGLLTAVNYPTYKETYQYDQRGRQTAVTQHLSADQTRTQRQGYDAAGQRISSTDPAGRTTLYQYDGLGRVAQTTDPMAQHTRQGWNAHDQRISLTDANGNMHRFEYDKKGNKTKEIRPMGGAILYSYDPVGKIVQRIDAGSNTRGYSYNAAERLVQERHKLNGVTLDQYIAYQYEKDGLLASYVQNDGGGTLISSASYTQDSEGRISQSAVTYGKVDGGGVLHFTIGQSFNQDGQLASHTYPDGSQQTYSYIDGLLTKVTLPNGSEISYQDYQWMQPTRIQTPGAAKTIAYDALQRYTSIRVLNNASELLVSRQYEYDPAGNIVQIESDLGITQYGYDKLSRLTQVNPDNVLQALGLPQEQYGYDAVGNRLSSAHQPGEWGYNGDNQLTQYPKTTPFSTMAPQDTQVGYTSQGNMAQEKSGDWQRDYRYNAAERLIEINQNGQTTNYRYDPFGRRISKDSGSPSTTTYYLYSDFGLIGEMNSQRTLVKAYGWNVEAAQQGLWSTDPTWQAEVSGGSLASSASTYHYLHTDHLAMPMLATDKGGNATWKGVSEAFGATKSVNWATEMNLRLPGQYWDRETNSHYNFRRDYKVELGRYIQSDPIGLGGGVNIYLYVDGDPLMGIDSKGLLSSVGAYRHYCGASGGSLNVDFGSINFAHAEGKIRDKVIEKIGRDCSERKIPFYWIKAFNATGDDFLVFGNVVLRIDGEIKVECDCSWTFSGEMKSHLGYDIYDFNAANRGFFGEALTSIGRSVCSSGMDYRININGKRGLNFSGVERLGRQTCCKN